MNKKVLYSILATIVISLTVGIVFVMSKTQGKNLILTVNKVYLAYSSFLIDMGYAPDTIADLYENQKNVAKWNGPYVSKSILDSYTGGNIEIVQASNIPTKSCALDHISYCYKWVKVTNASSSDYDKVKAEAHPKTALFYAENSLFFKLSAVE